MIYLDENQGIEIQKTTFFICIRLLNPLRMIILFTSLQKTLNDFIKAVLAIYKTFLSLLVLMLFYSLFGLYLFYGLEENRCRITPTPLINQKDWPVVFNPFPSYCGDLQCDQGL